MKKLWQRLVERARWKFLKRRRVIGWDCGTKGSCWILAEYDGRTGVTTIIDSGEGAPSVPAGVEFYKG